MIMRDGADALRSLVESSAPFVAFQVERIIDHDGVRSAEDKDRAIGELRPVLAELPESVLRDDLVRRVAARLDLPEGRLTELLGAPRGGRAGANGSTAGGRGGAAGVDPEALRMPTVDRTVHNEQAFLSLCIAIPVEGERVLAAVDPEQLLTSEVLRRAARHLSGRLATPFADLPPEDEELARAVADLVRRAGSSMDISADRLEHSRLLLELGGVDRSIKRARVERGGDVTALARARESIRAQIGEVTERIERTV
jgi:DNA primase